MLDLPRVVGFDGDDTLWHNETIFSMTQERFRALIGAHVDLPGDAIDARLVETERQNLATYGYGIKGFVLSMLETAIAIEPEPSEIILEHVIHEVLHKAMPPEDQKEAILFEPD